MTTPPRPSPVFAPVQDLFNRHVFGRAPVAVVSPSGAQAASIEPEQLEEDIDDLAQRVRNVGEW
jgi:hypothetical protein